MSNKVKLMEITDNLLAQYNTDINGNIQAIHIIREQVVGSKDFSVVLGQIPDSQQGVAIINPDNFYEVFNYDDLTEQSYYRKDRRVYFHPSMSGKTVKVDYYGIGIDLISASSIYTRIDDYGNIIETLDDMFEVGKTVLDGLRTIGDTVTIIQQLKDTNIESTNLLRQISDAVTELQAIIKLAETTNNTLNTTISTGNNKHTEWNKTIVSGNKVNSILTQTNQDADTKNSQLTQVIKEVIDIDAKLNSNKQQASQINEEINASAKKGQEILNGLHSSEIGKIQQDIIKCYSPTNKPSASTLGVMSTTGGNFTGDVSINDSKIITLTDFIHNSPSDENGYFEFPGGMILQFGTARSVISQGTEEKTITLPKRFPNAMYYVGVSIQSISGHDVTYCKVGADNYLGNSFRQILVNDSSESLDIRTRYIAIGR